MLLLLWCLASVLAAESPLKLSSSVMAAVNGSSMVYNISEMPSLQERVITVILDTCRGLASLTVTDVRSSFSVFEGAGPLLVARVVVPSYAHVQLRVEVASAGSASFRVRTAASDAAVHAVGLPSPVALDTSSVSALLYWEPVLNATGVQLHIFQWTEGDSTPQSLCALESRAHQVAVGEARGLAHGLEPNTTYGAVLVLDAHALIALSLPYRFTTEAADKCNLVGNLSFCDVVEYNAFTKGRRGLIDDRAAAEHYSHFLAVVKQLDCRYRYSAWTCEDCKVAYRNWLCATLFPLCTSASWVEPCIDMCHDVARKCPVYINFKCPERKPFFPCNHLDSDPLETSGSTGSRQAQGMLLAFLVGILVA